MSQYYYSPAFSASPLNVFHKSKKSKEVKYTKEQQEAKYKDLGHALEIAFIAVVILYGTLYLVEKYTNFFKK